MSDEDSTNDGASTATSVVDKPKPVPISPANEKKIGSLISNELLSSLMDSAVDDDTSKVSNKTKKDKKNKKSKQGTGGEDQSSDSVVEDEQVKNEAKAESEEEDLRSDENLNEEPPTFVDPEGLTVEQRVRKDRPSSRIRFTESAQPGFVSMGLENVGVMYGNNVVLKQATFSVSTGERVGLVGPNGGGKSTQLKILAGELEPTTGDVIKSSSKLRVAFLKQEFADSLNMSRTLREELLASFIDEQKLLVDIANCEEELGKTVDDPKRMTEVLDQLQDLQEKAISKGAYNLQSKVEKIMDLTGFSSDDGNSLVSSFSGGWKMRIGLAKILLLDPNILLLDEPTNHLDLDSVMWLESFLPKQNIPMVIVSHDREFLDKVCNKIVDVEEGVTVSYQGNYSKFMEQKKERLETWRNQYDKQMRYVKEEEKWIKKAKGDPNLGPQVKSREAALEKLRNSDEWILQPPKDKRFRFRFPNPPRCGESMLEVSKLTHGFGTGKYKVLFQDVDFKVDRGERIGFIGPNGSGKSTMMKIIMGIETPQKGYAEFLSPNVVPNYYAQNQADALDLSKTVLETVQENCPSDYSFTDIRALLGQFMFKSDDVYKKLNVLSGGEKARVALCKMMLQPANLLLLDEPTNHLDITSKEVLEDALLAFGGSVMIISHDRYFMSQVVNTIFEFHNKTVDCHYCDYHDYLEKHSPDEALKEKVVSRYVQGDNHQISPAKEVTAVVDTKENKKSKNFGGSGVTCEQLLFEKVHYKPYKPLETFFVFLEMKTIVLLLCIAQIIEALITSRRLISNQYCRLKPIYSMSYDKKEALVERLLQAKQHSKLTFDQIGSELGVTNAYAAQLFINQAQLKPNTATKLRQLIPTISEEDLLLMQKAPVRNFNPLMIQEPLIYRLVEAMQHYGWGIKQIVNERFGDGIVSAIDIYVSVDKIKGKSGEDRVVVKLNGKFLSHIEQCLENDTS